MALGTVAPPASSAGEAVAQATEHSPLLNSQYSAATTGFVTTSPSSEDGSTESSLTSSSISSDSSDEEALVGSRPVEPSPQVQQPLSQVAIFRIVCVLLIGLSNYLSY